LTPCNHNVLRQNFSIRYYRNMLRNFFVRTEFPCYLKQCFDICGIYGSIFCHGCSACETGLIRVVSRRDEVILNEDEKYKYNFSRISHIIHQSIVRNLPHDSRPATAMAQSPNDDWSQRPIGNYSKIHHLNYLLSVIVGTW